MTKIRNMITKKKYYPKYILNEKQEITLIKHIIKQKELRKEKKLLKKTKK